MQMCIPELDNKISLVLCVSGFGRNFKESAVSSKTENSNGNIRGMKRNSNMFGSLMIPRCG